MIFFVEHKVLPAVWAMRCKIKLYYCSVYTYKSRLNIHGGKQEQGVLFWETYAPVAQRATIRFMLILSILYKWQTRQIYFIMAYPQADIEFPMYMEIPQGFEVEKSRKNHCLKLKKNLYGQKQAGRVWFNHIKDHLTKNSNSNKANMTTVYSFAATFYSLSMLTTG